MPRTPSARQGATRKRRRETSEHDHGYKLLFSHPLLVEELIRGFLPAAWADRLDFSTLKKVGGSFVTEDFRERHDDVIWKVRWKGDEDQWSWIYLLLELQSTPDPFMPVRLLVYVGLLLQELIRKGKLKAGAPLPPVLPVVLYHGKPRWRTPLDLSSQFTRVPPEVRRYLPKLRYLLLDESRLSLNNPELRENLAAALFRLETAEPGEAAELATDLSHLVPPGEPGLRRAFSIWLDRMFRKFSPGVTIPERIDLEDAPMLEQTLEEWGQKLRKEARKEGRKEGREEGREKGRKEGLQEGLRKGERKGELKGMQKMVLEMLRGRFGPVPLAVRQRVEEISSSEELRRISRRILKARSLDETGLA